MISLPLASSALLISKTARILATLMKTVVSANCAPGQTYLRFQERCQYRRLRLQFDFAHASTKSEDPLPGICLGFGPRPGEEPVGVEGGRVRVYVAVVGDGPKMSNEVLEIIHCIYMTAEYIPYV